MDWNKLDQALGATPQAFARRMDQTLLDLKEEKEVKRVAFRTVVIFGVILALLGTTAFAVVQHGLEWYYTHRFPTYQEYAPEKYSAIMQHLQTGITQHPVDDPEVHIAVTEASWAPEQGVLVISVTATAADPDRTELHPMWNLDADGSYVGDHLSLYADDEEARGEHWLWTENGFGPIDQMIAPGKQLLLLETGMVLLDNRPLPQDNSSMDAFVTPDGVVHFVLEVLLDEAGLAQQDPSIELTLPYTVTAYCEDDQQLYLGGRTGEVHFTLDTTGSAASPD